METTEHWSPANCEELIRLIHDRFDNMSKTYQRIAECLTQNPNEVAVKSVNSIASHCGIHAFSFVRFAQSLGFRGFKDLQSLFQTRLSTATSGFEAQKKALEGGLALYEDRTDLGFRRSPQLRTPLCLAADCAVRATRKSVATCGPMKCNCLMACETQSGQRTRDENGHSRYRIHQGR